LAYGRLNSAHVRASAWPIARSMDSSTTGKTLPDNARTLRHATILLCKQLGDNMKSSSNCSYSRRSGLWLVAMTCEDALAYRMASTSTFTATGCIAVSGSSIDTNDVGVVASYADLEEGNEHA
jgi:hypothetical protein